MRIRAHDVAAYVADLHSIPMKDFYGSSRLRRFARPRQIAMYCIRALCPHMSFPRIGLMMGNRDHTTILHGFRRIEELIETDEDVADAVDRVLFRFAPVPPTVIDQALQWTTLCASYGQAMKAAA